MSERPVRVLTPLSAKRTHPNPYITQLYKHLEPLGVEAMNVSVANLLFGRADIWHLHWPEAAIRHSNWLRAVWRTWRQRLLMTLARLRRVKLIWTVHNLRGHESYHADMERGFMQGFTRSLDGVIHLSQTGRRLAEAEWPSLSGRPSAVVVHGHYRDVFPPLASRADARVQLGIRDNSAVVAFAGLIRPYKNIPHLIGEFVRMADPAAELLVAGAPNDAAEAARVRSAADGKPAVHTWLQHLDDDALQRVIRAADLVVLPFRETLNSGSAILALSLGRPVLVPRAGALEELQATLGAQWVQCYDGELTADALRHGLVWAREGKRTAPDLTPLDWGPIASETMNAYRAVLARGQ